VRYLQVKAEGDARDSLTLPSPPPLQPPPPPCPPPPALFSRHTCGLL
jgi:hypothetical protein